MSYRIRPGKSLSGEFRRVARHQYTMAIDILTHQPDGPDEAIHDARKCFKRLRGLIRLVGDVAPEFRDNENARVRDIARTLASARDATALVEALDRLIVSEATAANHDSLFAIHARLAERRDRIAAEETGIEDRIAAAITGCEDGIKALHQLRLPGKRRKATAVLARGAAKNYGRAVSALARAGASSNPDDWHDLRKRIKYHRMHVQLLSTAWPGEMGLRAEIADLAGEALGDDHDLTSLDALIAADPAAIGTDDEIAILRRCMAARSARLHDQVHAIVTNLLKDDRRVVESRIAALWHDAAG
tara:strand:+ start:7669 stop:8577 length:909 start_codon:yes stop_codon:yes gene_type:complete